MLLFAVVALVWGTWAARRVGLLGTDARAGETIAVGIGSGVVVLASWWAALASAGRSSFTPAAVGFGLSIAIAVLRPSGARHDPGTTGQTAWGSVGRVISTGTSGDWPMVRGMLAGTAFLVVVAVLFGSSLAPSAHDGIQPLPFKDPAFYAVLGHNLATTGRETIFAPSGFVDLPGVPVQSWYHWGEIWLASAVSRLLGASPLDARYFVVLPVLLLATAGLAGTVVQRLTRPTSVGTFLFGFIACLLLAPVPWVAAPLIGEPPFVATLTAGMLYGINTYGLAAVAALLAMYAWTVLHDRRPTWTLALFAGCVIALLWPAHIAIALLAAVGAAGVYAYHTARSVRAGSGLPRLATVWRRTMISVAGALVLTLAWGLLTGHEVPAGATSPFTGPFNGTWVASIVSVSVGAGALLAIPIAWLLTSDHQSAHANLYLASIVMVLAGAVGWGIRDGDFNQFYLFFSGLTVFAAPAGAVALWSIWSDARDAGRSGVALGVMTLCVAQMEFGLVVGIHRVVQFGPGSSGAPLEILGAIERLPAGSKMAYACNPFDETTYGTPNLLSLTAYSGRPIVPMCFEVDQFGVMAGAEFDPDRANGDTWAPQKELYPSAGARPPEAVIGQFLDQHDIGYIYEDGDHPNVLDPGAIPIAASGDYQLLKLP